MNIKSSTGLSFSFLDNGSLQHITAGPVSISLTSSTPFSGSGANLWLRRRNDPPAFTALLGPQSNDRFSVTENGFVAKGSWNGLEIICMLDLSDKSMSWRWNIELENHSDETVELDLICVQDVGLKTKTDGLTNEYYVSQYLERRILEDKNHGCVICCRQNMRESEGNPWLMMASKNRAVKASTDGMQFYGKTYRETGIPEGLIAHNLGGEYAGESSVIALQESPFSLDKGERYHSSFVAAYLPDHPQASSTDDLKRLPALMKEFDGVMPSVPAGNLFSPVRNLFNTSVFLPVEDLNEEEISTFFSRERRHADTANGRLLSFFCGQNNHVMLRMKETLVDRPHGHIIQANTMYVPHEGIVSTTCFAFGVFNSQVTQGNTNFNLLLSVCSSQFNLSPETGQRIFVEVDGRFYLLGVPSAFEMGLNHCRWIYKHGDHCFQVRTWTSCRLPQVNMDFSVIHGPKIRIMVTHHFDNSNGWVISPVEPGEFVAKPDTDSIIAGRFPHAQFRISVQYANADYKAFGDEVLFEDAKKHGNTLLVLKVHETKAFCLSFTGEVGSAAKTNQIENADDEWLQDTQEAQSAWQDFSLKLALEGKQEDVEAIREILPWYGMNALTHYLTPHGLEQFSGAAWGTRDVTQGPFDLLLCMEKYEEARQVLCIIFSNQNPDGGWPQWWMFDRYSDVRADSAHNDIYYWCILALSNYISITGDLKILEEVLPYYHKDGSSFAEKATLGDHVERLMQMIVNSYNPGTALVPFGGGDWNDSLQPVSKALAKRMISSWTVEMNYQAFMQYQAVYEKAGRPGRASEIEKICERIRSDFNRFLIRDGVVAGYGMVEEDNSVSLLLHPADTKTPIRYSILPMERGIISGIFSEKQARLHLDLIELHLKGPDGARLMDRPLPYHGGIQTLFQRAESSTFFGREIGLMYVHEHIRYAESLACTGRAEAFLQALRQAIPVAYREIVPCSDIRQSNCYYSSSDVVFRNRYEADEQYDEIKTGKHELRGGWRIYSSGPGIFINLIVTRLLGLRRKSGKVILDPVMPSSLNGLTASIDFMGHTTTFIYIIKEDSFGPKSVAINGHPVTFVIEDNKYRRGGAVIANDEWINRLNQRGNRVEIQL